MLAAPAPNAWAAPLEGAAPNAWAAPLTGEAGPHEAIATTARSNRYYRTKQSLLPHEAIATTARSNRYYRMEQSLLPHEAIATTARSNRYYRTKQSLLPHKATAPPARSNRYYRTKPLLLPHKAIATPARSNRFVRKNGQLWGATLAKGARGAIFLLVSCDPPESSSSTKPSGPWAQIAAGHTHTMAIDKKGRLYAWGGQQLWATW